MATVDASPTKEFFIKMLTRDIALEDAILDLLDNCLDGIVRIKGDANKSTDSEYYKGYTANIRITKNSFEIEDNCGGIPREKAEKYAFRMGQTSDEKDHLPTVGIYGIGMKRAIFKIGKEAIVQSVHKNEAFSVDIPENWIDAKENWVFFIKKEEPNILPNNGTKIKITKLNDAVAAQFEDDFQETFIDGLIDSIQASYSFIIEKGFEIFVNDKPVKALPIMLYVSEGKGQKINPYIFKKSYSGDVNVSFVVGFYEPPPSDEIQDESAESKRTTPDAGWTIVCNDRIVLYNDKTHLTGWGEAQVPKYHTQFIGIRGIVVFESKNPENLPMTTTKRGIDLSSPIYAEVKNRMREGIKIFTNFTNQWKGKKEEERDFFGEAEKTPTASLLKGEHSSIFTYKSKNDGSTFFSPSLPVPNKEKTTEFIRFSKPTEEIEILRNYFTEGDKSILMSASEVGASCFKSMLSKVKKDLKAK